MLVGVGELVVAMLADVLAKAAVPAPEMLAAQAIEEEKILAVWARSAGVLTMLVTGMVMVAAVV